MGESLTAEKEAEAILRLPAEVSENLRTASSFSDFVDIVKDYRLGASEPVLALLDFDRALSDNRIMRLRQSQVFHNHLRKIIKDVVLPSETKGEVEGIESRLSELLGEVKQ